MKRNFMLFSVAVLLLGATMIGCEEDHGGKSRAPIYKDLTLTPNPVYTGQKVTGLVAYDDPGAYIYSCDYQYSVSDGTSETWRQVSPTESQPEFSFLAPEKAGNYTVTFHASKIRYSSTDPKEAVYGSANTVQANLNVKSSQVINANWGDKKDDLMTKIDATDSASLLVWKGNVVLTDETMTELSQDQLASIRLYHFGSSGLNKVEQTAMRRLIRKSSYNTVMEQYMFDSLASNHEAAIDLYGLTSANILDGFDVESSDDYVLTGPAAAKYPVADWSKYNEAKKTELVRAFWRGELERYQVTLYSGSSKCVATAYVNQRDLILEWVFTEI